MNLIYHLFIKSYILKSLMGNRIWLPFFLLLSLPFFGQDTLTINSNSHYDNYISHLWEYPVTHTQTAVKDFTHTGIHYKYEKNEFSRKQTARETSNYGFMSMGLFNLKNNWKLFGDLSMDKTEEKDVSWILSDERTNTREAVSPHYFYVPRAGNWNNQKYRITGGVSKKLQNFSAAAKINYRAEKFSRNTDPRPEITNNSIQGELQLGYNFLPSHQIFVSGSYSRLNKDTNIKYRNSQLNSVSNPETYLLFNTGYGRIINYPQSNSSSKYSYFQKENNKKIGGGYSYQHKNTRITASYSYNHNMDNFYLQQFEEEKSKRFQYRIKSHHSELFIKTGEREFEYLGGIYYNKNSGLNYDLKNEGSNYKNSLQSVGLKSSLKKAKNDLTYFHIGIQSEYNFNKYKDYIAWAYIEMNSLNVGIFGDRDFYLSDTDKLNTGVNMTAYFPVSSRLEYYNTSGGENTFVTEVLIHDYAVNTTNHLMSGIDLQYIHQLKNKKDLVFYAQLQSIFALQNSSRYSSINTGNSYYMNIGIQLNY